MIPSRPLRVLLVTAAVTASLAACQRNEKKEAPAAPAASAHAVEGPLKYDSATPYAKVSLSLPENVLSYPALYTPLYRDEVAKLKEYAEGAQADRTEEHDDEEGVESAEKGHDAEDESGEETDVGLGHGDPFSSAETPDRRRLCARQSGGPGRLHGGRTQLSPPA